MIARENSSRNIQYVKFRRFFDIFATAALSFVCGYLTSILSTYRIRTNNIETNQGLNAIRIYSRETAIDQLSLGFRYRYHSGSGFNACSGNRIFSDAIILTIASKQSHNSTMNFTTNNDNIMKTNLLESFYWLQKFYPAYKFADILIFLEDSTQHAPNLRILQLIHSNEINIRFCQFPLKSRAANSGFWGPVDNSGTINRHSDWMTTIWPMMYTMGYRWAMNIDENFQIRSTINYNIFDRLRLNNKSIGYRASIYNCGLHHNDFSNWLQTYNLYRKNTSVDNSEKTHCPHHHFFVTEVQWWLRKDVVDLLDEFHNPHSKARALRVLYGDSIILTSSMLLFMPTSQIQRFASWSYRSVMRNETTIRSVWAESGTDDINWHSNFVQFFRKYEIFHGLKSPLVPRSCHQPLHTCDNPVVPCITYLYALRTSPIEEMPIHCHSDTDVMMDGFYHKQSDVNFNDVSLEQSVIVVMGMARSLKIASFQESIESLRALAPKTRAFAGISWKTIQSDPSVIPLSRGTLIELVLVPDFDRFSNNRTAQYSVFRNLVYSHATQVIPLHTMDYIIIADMDMVYPITKPQWATSFTTDFRWDVMTSNGIIDRTHSYYDIFAYRPVDEQFSTRMTDINPLFAAGYNSSWSWVPQTQMFSKFTNVRAAHGGISIYDGGVWARVVGNSRKPFDEGLPYDVCEHVPLQQKFSTIYINPHLVYYHKFEYALPFDRYDILLPREKPILFLIHSLVNSLSLSRRMYPLWNKSLMDYRYGNITKLTRTGFVRNESNAFLTYFEPIQYSLYDKTMTSQEFDYVKAGDYPMYKPDYLRGLVRKRQNLYKNPLFLFYRQHLHHIYNRFIRPKNHLLNLANRLLSKGVHRIGVYFRCEQRFLRKYFDAVDRLLNRNPDAEIFISSNYQAVVQSFISRYGPERVKHHHNFKRFQKGAILNFRSNQQVENSKFLLTSTSFPNLKNNLVGVNNYDNFDVTGDFLEMELTRADESLIDVLSLSICQDLIGTSTSIGLLMSSYINPHTSIHIIEKKK